ncbi:MAG: endo-1,4-beta-xylanase, partial [bacterium]|nr:endo-1,4-beta-xylanase [bacterium]
DRDRFAFDDADLKVDFAEDHGMPVRGHALLWHRMNPGWVEKGSYTGAEWQRIVENHIATVVGRYRGRIHTWDVVNEAATGRRRLRDTVWRRELGRGYVRDVFHMAHEADPDALLFYNDYGAEGLNAKADRVFKMVKKMLRRDVPIHGVGLQMHVNLNNAPPMAEVKENMARLGDLGLRVHITEMDVALNGPPSDEALQRQADVYRAVMEVVLESEHANAVVLWGVSDRYSWIPNFQPGKGWALILDENYQPKPAHDALRHVLAPVDSEARES